MKNINIDISTLGKDLQSYVVFANETHKIYHYYQFTVL